MPADDDEEPLLRRRRRLRVRPPSPSVAASCFGADVTRWKTINKALDLPFDDPAETYSTSEHFFHDMGIAPGTKGRLRPEKPQEPRAPRSSGPSPRDTSADRSREDRPRRDRGRSRTRSGQPVEGSPASAAPSAPQDGSDAGEAAGGRTRNRRRRRSGTKPAATSTD